ncbi:Triosephosphate isomerase [Gloeophyllum trabeum ATCC 11539]|uniref:Triosephosphate isomerase n=1 Tax=Gloeophyllum trabeum (strain ATCC 11539 / FP-39264 / Madison 617) TaxID=670483 RepID=S7PV33_GLOTA|nr:Triosephosphate isomerase [Gloeophyllum trabeum ATCC 11539]EPQ51247.1 Triosephosphate isomerase [Gloeophyllum trabeum ATCC 11539]
MARKFFVGGNYKMNPATKAAADSLVKLLNEAQVKGDVDIVVAPPAIYLLPIRDALKNQHVQVAAQNCYLKDSGAFTGEISPAQLADAGIPYVILGHSERRTLFHESSDFIAQKTRAALDKKLSVILCVGETLAEREAGKTTSVVQAQLEPVVKLVKESEWSKIVIAYEPVWAIGTGKVATSQQAQETHAEVRAWLTKSISSKVGEETRIIYGGSVTGASSRELASQSDVDGFLVGGASLKPEFVDIFNSKA